MTIINIASKKSIYIIPGSKSYTLMPEIYTPVDMDMLDSAGLYSVQRDLDVLIVSDNNTALRQYLSKKTIQGAVSAESIQDLMAATLINSVYDDEANTILVGGSGGNGGFAYGGDWDATPIDTGEIAPISSFDVLHNATISGNALTQITANVDFGATATNLSHSANVGTWHKFRVTVPDTTSGFFRIALHTSNQSEPSSVFADESASLCGLMMGHGSSYSISIYNHSTFGTYILDATINAGDVIRVEYRSDIYSVCFYNETGGGELLRQFNNIQGFNDSPVHLTVLANDVGTTLSFDFADDYPIYQSVFNLDYPEDLTKTYRVSAANAHSVVNGKLLKVNDFVDFITNEDDEVIDIVVSRLVSDRNIRDAISTALNEPTSSVYTQTQSLGGTAGLDSVVSALNGAVNDSPSDLTTSLDNFLAYILANNASLFHEALRTYVQDAVYAYIQNDVDYNGDIYNAIAQYVEDSTTGIGHSAIQTAIENYIQNYADGIGVGPNGQDHLTVQEAAQSVISNEIQSGGIIDTAIQAVINL